VPTTLLLSARVLDDTRLKVFGISLFRSSILGTAINSTSLKCKNVLFRGLIDVGISHVYVLGWWESTKFFCVPDEKEHRVVWWQKTLAHQLREPGGLKQY
jgi:hypothetical protein